jgi:signal transduction histidine kinase
LHWLAKIPHTVSVVSPMLHGERVDLQGFRRCLGPLPVILASTDRSARYLWLHAPQLEIPHAKVVGKTDLELGDGPGARALHELKLEVLRSEQTLVDEFALEYAGNRTFEVTAAPRIEAGAVVGVSTLALDVTDRRASTLADAREEQLRLLSHDLRQPLHVISMIACRLSSTVETGSLIDALCGRIQATARAMSRALEDVLDAGASEVGAIVLHREPTPLGPFLRETLDYGVAPDKLAQVELEVTTLGAVEIDRAKLGRAVLNLVDNALKFSPSGAPVRVCARRFNGKIQISVSDQGPGLDGPESRVFERYQASARSRALGGKGLGLYCARMIVEAHGGACRVDTAPGRGATFWIELPWVAGGPLFIGETIGEIGVARRVASRLSQSL